MATFFSLYTILLLSIAGGDLLFRASAASALGTVCAKTRSPARCQSLLKSSDSRSQTATLAVLAQISIDAATYSAGGVKIKVHNLAIFTKDSNLKKIYRNCENLYANAMDQLYIAPEYLKQRSYKKLVAAAGVIGVGVRGCAAAVAKDAALKQQNEDAGVLSDAIAVAAKSLA